MVGDAVTTQKSEVRVVQSVSVDEAEFLLPQVDDIVRQDI